MIAMTAARRREIHNVLQQINYYNIHPQQHSPTNEPQKVALKMSLTDVIGILKPARLSVLQVGGHSSLSNG